MCVPCVQYPERPGKGSDLRELVETVVNYYVNAGKELGFSASVVNLSYLQPHREVLKRIFVCESNRS